MNSQQQAIEKTEGPCIILAGPGTGKTTTVVDKIKHLVEQGVCKPSEILCLTFSNEATNAIKTKVLDKLKASADVEIETFHSFCADVLREEGRLIGIDPGFEILDPDDAKVVFHKYFGISPFYANRYVATIHTAKDFGITIAQIKEYFKELEEKLSVYCHDISKIDEYADNLDLELSTMHLSPSNTPEQKKKSRERKNEIKSFLDVYNEFTKYKEFIDSWEKYDKLKNDKKYQDYADLNFNVLMLFNKYGPKNFSMRYKYVIVDEFQDTNKIQFEIIEHLAAEHRNITIVGDPNQSVYGFRGAYREIFNNFMEAFKVNEKTDVFRLDKSYRSPNSVLKAAHKLITNNYEKAEECFLVQNAYNIEGDNIKLIELKNSSEEARKIAEIVEKEIENGMPMHQICVLFRTHRQGDILRQALESKNIPLAAAGRTDLMQKPEIRTIISFLSIINNLRERTGTGEQAWWSLFHYHNALTPEDSVKIGRYLKNRRNDDTSIDEALLTCLNDIKLSQHGEKIVKSLITKLRELVKVANKALPDLILDIYEMSGLNRAFTHRRTTRNTEALMNLKLFYEIAEKYWTMHEKDINGFIKYIEILDDLGVEIQASQITNLNAVRFMTLHAVKGLEFDVVILSNLADDRFPIERTRNEPLIPKDLLPDLKKHIESLGDISEEEKIEAIKDYEREVLLIEERRLCYVGITRTKKKLILTFARSYNDEENSTTASIFLREIGYDNWKEQKTYENIDFIIDNDEKCTIFAPSSSFEQFKSKLKDIIVESLDTDNFQILLSKLITYHAVRDKEIPDYHKLINDNWGEIFDLKSLQGHVNNHNKKISGLKFEPEPFVFSPTSLLTYDECPKKYELAHIYQMPERGAFEWSGASTGSFIHKVLEAGVSDGFTSKQQFLDHALSLSKDKEWEGVDLEDVNHLIEIFWKRNEGSYNSKSLCEKKLPLKIDAFSFFGIADRIDFLNDKDVRIVDYKTNKDTVDPKSRSWQLGYYALATKEALNLNPKQLVLEMLRLEKPFEVELDGSEAKAGRSKGFNLEEVKNELIEAAKKIMYDYEHEFMPVKDDAPCRYCGFKFYCPKWEEK